MNRIPRTYPTLTDKSADLPKLREDLAGNRHKFPSAFTFEGDHDLFRVIGYGNTHRDPVYESIGTFRIVVIPSPTEDDKGGTDRARKKSSSHRAFVRHGDRLIPVGRIAQAKI